MKAEKSFWKGVIFNINFLEIETSQETTIQFFTCRVMEVQRIIKLEISGNDIKRKRKGKGHPMQIK